jgi:hypothetical protein
MPRIVTHIGEVIAINIKRKKRIATIEPKNPCPDNSFSLSFIKDANFNLRF